MILTNKVQFIPRDYFKTSTKRMVLPLINFVVKNDEYLYALCEALLKFNNIQSISGISSGTGQIRFDRWLNTLTFPQKDEKKLSQFKDHLLKIYNTSPNHQELSNRRGMALEMLIREFVFPRYSKQGMIHEQGCIVKINGNEVLTPNRQTVDIAGWNGTFLETHETKVGPDLFDEDVIEYLCLLSSEMKGAQVNGIVSCVTMSNCSKLKNRLQAIKEQSGHDYTMLSLYGQNEIVELRQQPLAS